MLAASQARVALYEPKGDRFIVPLTFGWVELPGRLGEHLGHPSILGPLR